MMGDEKSIEDLSHVVPRAFLFSYDGNAAGCTRLRFQPNPIFSPATYEQLMLHALVGTVLIKEPDDRVSGLDARVSHPVEFGFGLLGKLDENERVQIVRTQTSAGSWQISLITVHIVGRMLGLKSISRYHDEVRTEIKDIPPRMSLAQAAELTKP
jgi:hypothetical protein